MKPPIDLRTQAKEEHEHEDDILDLIDKKKSVRKSVLKIVKDVHSYHSPKMLRCLSYMESQGKDSATAHKICYDSIGDEANTESNPDIKTRSDLKRETQAAFDSLPESKLKEKQAKAKGSVKTMVRRALASA